MADTNGGVVIKVKALEFVGSETGEHWHVRICGREYVAYITQNGDYMVSVWDDEHLLHESSALSIDSALSTLQAHHTQHVLSMIEIDTPTNQGKQP